jgi:hypothetical protein
MTLAIGSGALAADRSPARSGRLSATASVGHQMRDTVPV